LNNTNAKTSHIEKETFDNVKNKEPIPNIKIQEKSYTPPINKENSTINIDIISQIKNNEQKIKLKNALYFQSKEDEEFYDALKTVVYHKNKSTEEIIKDLSNTEDKEFFETFENINKNVIEKNSPYPTNADKLNNVIRKMFTDEIIKKIEDSNNKNQNNMKDIINCLGSPNGKEKLESLIKQKNNTLKYMNRKAYKEAKKKRICVINLILVLSIISIFLFYYFYSKLYI
jgi:hypothetical protein